MQERTRTPTPLENPMTHRTLPARTGLVSASLVLCGVLAGGVLGSAGVANAAGSTGSTTTTTAARPADTPVTGTEADKVIAAVKAKYPTATVTTVRKDADGSYDALGTAANGTRAFYDVSADLATVTAGGGRGGTAGRGRGGAHTAATAAQTTAVKDAVRAKDATVTVTTVRKDADGSFDALGTDASGNKVSYDVSADYTTVTAHAAR